MNLSIKNSLKSRKTFD